MTAHAARWADAVALALAGGVAGFAVAGAWLWRLEQSLETSCDLGCVVFLPLFPALAFAGGFAGLFVARRGWRATAPGWGLLATLAAAVLVFPQALAWLLLVPFDLVRGFSGGLMLFVLVLWSAVPAASFWAACRVAGGKGSQDRYVP